MSFPLNHAVCQSGVLPYRYQNDELQILLITSRGRKRWIIPKGFIESDITPCESAINEAYEEAGIRGEVDETPFGKYSYSKWDQRFNVHIYPMHVTEELPDWPEKPCRTRIWVSFDNAIGYIKNSNLLALIRSFERSRFLNEH